MILPKRVMVDVVIHGRNQHNDVEVRVGRFLDIATKCRCFGIQCNGTTSTSEPVHFF